MLARYALPITRILHCPRAGAGWGSDNGRAPQPEAGSARLRRAWCQYHCWSYALPTCHATLGRTASAPYSGSPWRRLPACVQASSPPPFGAGRGRWCVGTNLVQHNRLRTGNACMPGRLDDRHEHIQHPRDQDGERYATRRIVSTAGAAAWLPHSKLRDTHMMCA